MKVAALQMNSSAIVEENLKQASMLIDEAVKSGAELLLLPENFACMPVTEDERLQSVEKLGAGPIQQFLSEQAKNNHVVIVAGSMSIIPSDQDLDHIDKVFNTSMVYSAEGELICHYNKQHLFDVDLNQGNESYRESSRVEYGATFNEHSSNQPIFDTRFGKVGLSICYDLRFPEYFRYLSSMGINVLLMPAAFTYETGMAHWEILIRARAIENQVYVIASGQTGFHDNGRRTFGQSMIVDPWGNIIANADAIENGVGVVYGELDIDFMIDVRKQIPCLQHRRYL